MVGALPNGWCKHQQGTYNSVYILKVTKVNVKQLATIEDGKQWLVDGKTQMEYTTRNADQKE